MRWLVLAFVMMASRAAAAGPATYGWVPATELVPAEEVEVAGWIGERNDVEQTHERSTFLGWAPTFGLADRLELRLPVEATSRSQLGEERSLQLTRFGGEGRYRFTERTSPFAPVVRAAVARDVALRTVTRVELELAASYEVRFLQVAAATAFIGEFSVAGPHEELHPSAGASARVWRELRCGAEIYAERSRDSVARSWMAAGPTIAWRTRQSWLVATYAFGIDGIGRAPRLQWGLAW